MASSPVVIMLMVSLLLIGLVATSTLATLSPATTATPASSIDIDDLKWSFNASKVFVVPTSLPRSYYNAHIYIPMVSTPKAGLCRFVNGRDDSEGRGWLKVQWGGVTYDHVDAGQVLPTYLNYGGGCSFNAWTPLGNSTYVQVSCKVGSDCLLVTNGASESVGVTSTYSDPSYSCVFASQNNASLTIQTQFLWQQPDPYLAMCGIPERMFPDLDLTLTTIYVAYNQSGRGAVTASYDYPLAFRIPSSYYAVNSYALKYKWPLLIEGTMNAFDQYFLQFTKVGSNVTFATPSLSGSNNAYTWFVDATLRNGLDLHYNDTLEMKFMWLSSLPGSLPQVVTFIGSGFNTSHQIVQWNEVDPTPDPNPKKDGNNFPTAIVIGSAGGGIVVLAIGIYCCCRRRNTSTTTGTGDEETGGYSTDHHTGTYQQVNAQPVGRGH